MRHNITTLALAAAVTLGGAAYAAPALADAGGTELRPIACGPVNNPCEQSAEARIRELQAENMRLRKSIAMLREQRQRVNRALSTPCASEDSPTCYWEAHERGNGKGTSFVVVGQHYFYLGSD